jgi:hypothetical protein
MPTLTALLADQLASAEEERAHLVELLLHRRIVTPADLRLVSPWSGYRDETGQEDEGEPAYLYALLTGEMLVELSQHDDETWSLWLGDSPEPRAWVEEEGFATAERARARACELLRARGWHLVAPH